MNCRATLKNYEMDYNNELIEVIKWNKNRTQSYSKQKKRRNKQNKEQIKND